jgi:molybdopterin-containing oxidoreductase family membrane subunit
MVACNVLIPQLFWISRVRTQMLLVFVISILVNVGMWFERFVIIVTALERDFLLTSWTDYAPTSVELATLAGSFGLFFTCFLLFCRYLPTIAIAEVKTIAECNPSAADSKTGDLQSAMGDPQSGKRIVQAVFARQEDLLRAVEAARQAGGEIVDIRTPYPVHETFRVMGLPRSRLPAVALAFGLLGVASALLFQYWSSAVDWPLNVGGRPFNSLPAFVPVAFETMVLFAGVGVVLAWLVVSRLYPGKPAATSRATDNRFILEVRATGPQADADAVRRLFGECLVEREAP